MINKFIHLLKKIEKLAHISDSEKSFKPYKEFKKVWIRADKPLRIIYKKNLQNSELHFFPNKNYRVWGVWILKLFGFKKTNRKLQKLLGIGLNWKFLKKQNLPLEADLIYYRHHTAILVYKGAEHRKVIKVALTKVGQTIMQPETNSQRLAASIQSKNIFIPAILQEYKDGDIYFTVEQYFEGKRQSFKNKKTLIANYHKVFEFLMKFYLKNPIQLKDLSESKFLNHTFVEGFIEKRNRGTEVLNIFKHLYSKRKKMILCVIHGDLNHNNILYDGSTVCIIDWGKSKLHYLSEDLDNTSYDTRSFYKEFIKKADIKNSEVYSYHEQLFLGRFVELNRRVFNTVKRKAVKSQFLIWVENQNQILIEMAKNIQI